MPRLPDLSSVRMSTTWTGGSSRVDDPFGQFQQDAFIPLKPPGRDCLVALNDGGGGRTEDANCAHKSGRIRWAADDGIIKWRFRLVIRTVVALIHRNQTEIGQRGKERRARPDDDLQLTQTGTPPGVVALAFGQPGMHQSNLPREASQEPANRLRSNRNFRDEDDGFFSAVECIPVAARI